MYYHDYGYGIFRKKVYAENQNQAIAKFKRLLDDKFTFGKQIFIRELKWNQNKSFSS